jgi:hypothetical protein
MKLYSIRLLAAHPNSCNFVADKYLGKISLVAWVLYIGFARVFRRCFGGHVYISGQVWVEQCQIRPPVIDQRDGRRCNVNITTRYSPTLGPDVQNDVPGTLVCAWNAHG